MAKLADRSLLECPICRDLLNDPRLVSCLHTFCAGCLKSYVSTFADRRTIPCPVCRTTIELPASGVDDLPKNTAALNRLEMLRKSLKGNEEATAEEASAVQQS
jgi:hypothetical protein